MNNRKLLRILTGVLVSLLIAGAGVYALETSYDRYTSEGVAAPETGGLGKVLNKILTYPFELFRWPTSKGAVFMDQHHVMDKGQWLYEKAVDYGVTLRFDGADLDFLRMTNLKMHVPDAVLQGWFDYHPHDLFKVGGKAGWDHIGGMPLHIFTTLDYEDRPEENFFGIGPDTSRGDSTSYHIEQTKLEQVIGYSENPSFNADIFAGYKRVNIDDGTDGAKGTIGGTFSDRQSIPGVGGDEIFSTGLRLVRDKRNYKEDSTKGYLLRGSVSFNEGLYSSDARYMKYQAEGIHYLRLGSDRRVLSTRFYGEHNNETAHASVPFHQMAKLGGFGSSVEQSETLRGYDDNRFFDNSLVLFNIEYRYTVYEYRDWKVDTVLFWDEGQVFNHVAQFQLTDFRYSFGGGFRLSLLNNVLVSCELGHGDEGTHFYVKSRSPF